MKTRAGVIAAALVLGMAAIWPAATGMTRTDRSGAARESLLEADRAFDAATAERGVDGWVSFFADDAVMLPQGSGLVRGAPAIRTSMAGFFARKGASLRWTPDRAEVSKSGDLGYTYGTYVATAPGPDGKPLSSHGKYVTIWRRNAGGEWKAVLDMGNQGTGGKTERTAGE